MSKNSADKNCLGLGFVGFGSFKIPEIKANLVIVEIFSMYCPYCQREAPNVNQLYAKIEQNPALKGKIKIIGIGVDTTASTPLPVDANGRPLAASFTPEISPDTQTSLNWLSSRARTAAFSPSVRNPSRVAPCSSVADQS
jgi:thiol-disulfide isomerase/thioredoxin